jgi:hypothetical protein
MKRFLMLILALVMVAGLTACSWEDWFGGSSPTAPTEKHWMQLKVTGGEFHSVRQGAVCTVENSDRRDMDSVTTGPDGWTKIFAFYQAEPPSTQMVHIKTLQIIGGSWEPFDDWVVFVKQWDQEQGEWVYCGFVNLDEVN